MTDKEITEALQKIVDEDTEHGVALAIWTKDGYNTKVLTEELNYLISYSVIKKVHDLFGVDEMDEGVSGACVPLKYKDMLEIEGGYYVERQTS